MTKKGVSHGQKHVDITNIVLRYWYFTLVWSFNAVLFETVSYFIKLLNKWADIAMDHDTCTTKKIAKSKAWNWHSVS